MGSPGFKYGVSIKGELTVSGHGIEHVLDDGDLISYEAACSHRIRNSGKTRASAGSILAAVDLSEARPVPVLSTTASTVSCPCWA